MSEFHEAIVVGRRTGERDTGIYVTGRGLTCSSSRRGSLAGHPWRQSDQRNLSRILQGHVG